MCNAARGTSLCDRAGAAVPCVRRALCCLAWWSITSARPRRLTCVDSAHAWRHRASAQRCGCSTSSSRTARPSGACACACAACVPHATDAAADAPPRSSVLLYLLGIAGLVALPFLARNTYLDENGLLAGALQSCVARALSLRSERSQRRLRRRQLRVCAGGGGGDRHAGGDGGGGGCRAHGRRHARVRPRFRFSLRCVRADAHALTASAALCAAGCWRSCARAGCARKSTRSRRRRGGSGAPAARAASAWWPPCERGAATARRRWCWSRRWAATARLRWAWAWRCCGTWQTRRGSRATSCSSPRTTAPRTAARTRQPRPGWRSTRRRTGPRGAASHRRRRRPLPLRASCAPACSPPRSCWRRLLRPSTRCSCACRARRAHCPTWTWWRCFARSRPRPCACRASPGRAQQRRATPPRGRSMSRPCAPPRAFWADRRTARRTGAHAPSCACVNTAPQR